MPSLKRLLEQRTAIANSNLENGTTYVFKPNFNMQVNQFCWTSPAAGNVVIEVWGGNGAAAAGCCCGVSIPANSGAYAKKYATIGAGWYICGCIGHGGSGSTATNTNCGYCGCSSGMGIYNSSGVLQSCICAQPGTGGQWICQTVTANGYCCFLAAGYCRTTIGTNCGIVCNIGGTTRVSSQAQAFGGDVIKAGGIGKRLFTDATSAFWGWDCTPYSAGIVGCDVGYVITCLNCAYWDTTPVVYATLAAATRTSSMQHQSCCFEDYFPYSSYIARTTGKECHQAWGAAGGSLNTCAGQAAYGTSGAMGLGRIKFIP